jgi:anti-sigma factor RsiW
VSDHERERLSAYLDRELAPVERAEVEAHLAACTDCAAWLEQLAAVDSHAVGLVAEAPEGYFGDFASRVRARIEGSAAARPRGVPSWTWAVAAALLLAVVTPWTWREWRAPTVSETAPALRPTTAPQPTRGRIAVEGEAAAGFAAPPKAAAVPDAAHVAAPTAAPFGPNPAQASRRPLRGEEARLRDEARPAAPGAPKPRELDRRLNGRLEGLGGEEPAAAASSEESLAGTASSSEEKVDVSQVEAVPADGAVREKAERRAGASSGARVRASLPESEQAVASGFVGRTTRDAGFADDPGAVFGRLEARKPQSLAEWRAAREAWRAFAVTYAGSADADEARVRAIEASRDALAVGGTAKDAALLRRDAAEYLARTDALQKERVRRLLAALGRTP